MNVAEAIRMKRAHVALSFGYPADPEALTAPPRRGGRRALDTVIHYERWASAPV